MKKLVLFLALGSLLVSCGPQVKLNRLSGKKGPHYPLIQGNKVSFQVLVPEASLVTLAGNFNGWNAQITPMRADTNGLWTIDVELKAGKKYYYKYVIDGFWVADPDNPDTVPDGFSGQNSVIQIPREEK